MKFETIEAYNLPERIEAISKYLVSILSINGTKRSKTTRFLAKKSDSTDIRAPSSRNISSL